MSRRPLDGGTLLPGFLGTGNILSRLKRNERVAGDANLLMLSTSGASGAYVRRYGSLLFSGWGRENVAASLSAATLSRYNLTWQAPLILPFGGSVTGLMLGLNAQQTAGTLTVEVYVAGAASGMNAVIDDTDRLTVAEYASAGAYSFEAGEEITLRVTTSGSWAPTTAELLAMLEVSA